jgi:DNA-binding NarL/FixJ family response regulator
MDGDRDLREPIRILIAVEVRLYRDGVAAALNARDHLRVVGTAGTPLDTEAGVRDLQPDVIIVDASFPDVDVLLSTLRAQCSKSRILALAVREDIASILHCAEAGADGFVTTHGAVQDLAEAIERTAAGELLCSPRIAAQLLRRAAHLASRPTEHAVQPVLTNREQQVFAALKQGRSNKEIANALTIAEATVKNHVHHVLEKLQVATRGQAAAVSAPPLKATLRRRAASQRAS